MFNIFNNLFCPVCNKKNNKFLPLDKFYRDNAENHGYKYFGTCEMTADKTYSCSICGASDRERLYAYYIRDSFKTNQVISLYHFAPEKQLQNMILNYFDKINYKTFDLLSDDVDIKADITNLFMVKDNECDFFICSHVLEHVEDDASAIHELYRILKPGGKGILMAPVSLAIDKTIEKIPDVKTDEDRWRYYGQNDHIRLYAKNDFASRIRDGGFKLELMDIEFFGKKLFRSLGLKKTSVLYIVEK